MLALRCPIEHGIVTNWDDLELVWRHAFYSVLLRAEPKGLPVMLTAAPLSPKSDLERMVTIMMETYGTSHVAVMNQAVLALHSEGLTTGVVLDSGDGVTHCVPVYEGYALTHAVQRLPLGGRDLTEYLRRIITERGYSFFTSAEQEIVRDVKEQLCYVALNYEKELISTASSLSAQKSYELPDGQLITINSERFRAAEVLFQPSLIGMEVPGIHDMIYNTITKACTHTSSFSYLGETHQLPLRLGGVQSDVDVRKDLYSSVVLAGGSTMFPGLAGRLRRELKARAPPTINVRVIASPDRRNAVWTGGSVLASVCGFQTPRYWITRDQYDEDGPAIVHSKGFF